METNKNKLWDVDAKLFASMRDNSLTPNEANFFKNMQFKEEYEPTLSNDLIISEHDNPDEIYLVRVEYDEYLVGHGTNDHRDEELHVMNLSEALAVNLKQAGYLDRDITLWQWLRECDYKCVQYNHNYDNM